MLMRQEYRLRIFSAPLCSLSEEPALACAVLKGHSKPSIRKAGTRNGSSLKQTLSMDNENREGVCAPLDNAGPQWERPLQGD